MTIRLVILHAATLKHVVLHVEAVRVVGLYAVAVSIGLHHVAVQPVVLHAIAQLQTVAVRAWAQLHAEALVRLHGMAVQVTVQPH